MAFVWDIEKQIVFNTGFAKEEAQKIAKIAFRIKDDYFKDLVEFTENHAAFCAPYEKFPNELLDKVYTFDCMDKPIPEDVMIKAKRLCSEINEKLYAIDDPFFKYTYTEVEEGRGWYQIVTKLDQSAYGKYAYKQIIPIMNDEKFKENYNGSPQITVRKIDEFSLLKEAK